MTLCFDSKQLCNLFQNWKKKLWPQLKAVTKNKQQEGTAFLITIGIDLFH